MNKVKFFGKIASKGFTLIELLIVIAVLGVLAAVVLVAIDPVQQLARGRDAGRKSTIGQLGRAMQAYYTTRAAYPTVAEWSAAINILESSGEIKTFPANPTYSYIIGSGIPCVSNPVSGYCYLTSGTEVVIFARMESKSVNSNCAPPNYAWFAFSSISGRSGGACASGNSIPVNVTLSNTF